MPLTMGMVCTLDAPCSGRLEEMRTVFPAADPLREPLADDGEPLEQAAASVATATAAIAGASFLPFKIHVLSLTDSSACRSSEMPALVIFGGNAKRVAFRNYRYF